jgi:hypothetical protein
MLKDLIKIKINNINKKYPKILLNNSSKKSKSF